ncbi:WHG domain-containing protein [Cryobacterium sp. GrIS_2_6]|uniref:WHG domain-containing protein n=1 Tax=Cryobacterium sp. GrIS_2_6 TaxID=3162785 RepID=UPI002E020F89|nr:hypothetical protein [Cryobacterium psychrotolerans]
MSDLRAGWDSHNAFALAQPNAYRLLFGSGSVAKAESANEAMRLLRSVLERLAAQGRLHVAPEIAARVVMAANTGVALALILRPALYPDPAISSMMRDIVLGGLVADTAPAPDAGESGRIAAITPHEPSRAAPCSLHRPRGRAAR